MKSLMLQALCRNCVHTKYSRLLNFKLYALSMPKDRSYIPSLQKNRIKMRENKQQCNGNGYLQILGSGAPGAPKAVYFFTDYCRYMFNCGEGTQRLAHEHKVKIARLEHIFITYPQWENLGGLPGLALTVQEVGVPEITIHGPQGIDNLFNYTNRFVVLLNLAVKTAECDPGIMYEDPAITVRYVVLKKKIDPCDTKTKDNDEFKKVISEAEQLDDNTDYYSHMKQSVCKWQDQGQKLTDAFQKRAKSPESFNVVAMAYICQMKPKIGMLNLEACVEKGVPPGPLLGKLKNGEDVTLPDGTFVRSVDVKEPDSLGPIFIVVECPDVGFLDSLIEAEGFKKHQVPALMENVPRYVLHFTSKRIMEEEKYQKWMKLFPESTVHVNVNESNTCMGNVGCHILQTELNVLDSSIFPILNDKSIPVIDTPVVRRKRKSTDVDYILERAQKRFSSDPSENPNAPAIHADSLNFPPELGHTLRCLDLRPSISEDFMRHDCVYINPRSVVSDLNYITGFENQLLTLKEKLKAVSADIESELQEKPYPVITFLGTGSSVPNKTRNTSGILVTLSKKNHIILDCGEGTYGQLVRLFGYTKATKILSNTNGIFISHLHADHHMGLFTLLKKRREAVLQKYGSVIKVYVIAPQQIMFWLCNYHQNFENILDCIELYTNQYLENGRDGIPPAYDKLISRLKVQKVATTVVKHCPHAYGITFVDLNGTKITYSGDTMPCDNLVKLGMDSDVLIHEATFEDDLDGEARIKMHSTTRAAIDIGKQMNAKFTILTHFSQRYNKIPVISEYFDENVGVAFDNMTVRLPELRKLPMFFDIFKVLFSAEYHYLENAIKKKKMKFRLQ